MCLHRLLLEELCAFQIIDSKSRYSVSSIIESTNMLNFIEVFESTWLSEFWPPETVAFDFALKGDLLKSFLEKYGIKARPLPPRRQNNTDL